MSRRLCHTMHVVALTACTRNADLPPPVIDSLVPDRGSPGASVTIEGSHFCHQQSRDAGPQECDELGQVAFDVVQSSSTAYSDTAITVEVPVLAAGTVEVSVSVAGLVSNHVDFIVTP